MYHCEFGYGPWSKGSLSDENILAVLEPKQISGHQCTDEEIILESLRSPISSLPLAQLVKGSVRVIILVDDYTRLTPTQKILPIVLEELNKGGVPNDCITILVASGTHRPMTELEKIQKFGSQIVKQIPIEDHLWYEPEALASLDSTTRGTAIEINKQVLLSDFVIGIGHIVPHRVAGFSGGAKIVQPGICGSTTTGQTHWLSAKYFSGKEIIGVYENPVREEINEVGQKAGLKFIINTVQSGDGHIHSCFSGHPIHAHRLGCEVSLSVFGSTINELADIVIVDAYPAHVNMWQSSKGIYSGDLALKDDGVLILVAPCPEGVALEHPEVEHYGYAHPSEIERMVDEKNICDLTIAAHILHVGKVITGKRKAVIVSPGIPKKTAEHLGFIWASDLQSAIDKGFQIQGKDAKITILYHGGELVPLYKEN